MSRFVHVNVYTPQLEAHWTPFRTTRARVLAVWLTWLVRGLRFRLGLPALGRKVTLEDMKAHHPGKAGRCLCRGEGMIREHRDGEPGWRFCGRMEAAFKMRARVALHDTESGPRWLKGFEPERLALR